MIIPRSIHVAANGIITSFFMVNTLLCVCIHTYIYMYVYILDKVMATHSSTLAWKVPDRLQSTHWRRKWQPTPVFLPGESQGQGSLVGCFLRGRTELDTTEVT